MRPSSAPSRPRLALPPHPTRPSRRHAGAAAASGDGNRGGAAPVDSDAAYVAKVAAASVVGAAAVKYGSLFLDAPFHPDPAVALAMTVGPPVVVAAWLAVLKE